MFPDRFTFSIADWVNSWVDALVTNYGDVFRHISDTLLWAIVNLESLLRLAPWWLMLAIVPGILAIYYSDAQYLLIIRIIRMLRIFRILKLRPYLSQANYLLSALRGSKQKIIVFLVSVSTLVTVFGSPISRARNRPENSMTAESVNRPWP